MVRPVNNSVDCFHAYQLGYQQALDDFGVAQLLEKLSKFSNCNFQQQSLSPQHKELESLAALLIQLMSANLKGSAIARYLHAMRQGDAAVLSSLPAIDFQLPPFAKLPTYRSVPLFWLGEMASWKRLPDNVKADFGVVIGRFYLPAAHRGFQWGWKYLILLDKNSPSAAWTVADSAWEEDLQPLFQEEAK